MGLQSLAQKLYGSQAPLLQFLRTAVWAHILPPWRIDAE
jgi:hypothetical protein